MEHIGMWTRYCKSTGHKGLMSSLPNWIVYNWAEDEIDRLNKEIDRLKAMIPEDRYDET